MSRRLVLLATLMLSGLTGCMTMNDGYYREDHYSDGGYYYPAQDGYGDYYQGPEEIDYRYYDSYSYAPFWSLDRYSCGAHYSCSPYWNSYYRRPYQGWSLSFGSHRSYGNWGWYGNQWTPWYDSHDYWRQPRRPRPDDGPPPGVLSPGELGNRGTTFQDIPGRPRPRLGEPGVIDDDGGLGADPMPRPGVGGDDGSGERPGGPPGQTIDEPGAATDGRLQPLPRQDFRDPYERTPPSDVEGGDLPGGRPGMAPRPVDSDYRVPDRTEPRFERPDPREEPRFERPDPREEPRYEQPQPREEPRYEQPQPREEPRYEQPQPREEPRYERPEPREVRSESQNETADEER